MTTVLDCVDERGADGNDTIQEMSIAALLQLCSGTCRSSPRRCNPTPWRIRLECCSVLHIIGPSPRRRTHDYIAGLRSKRAAWYQANTCIEFVETREFRGPSQRSQSRKHLFVYVFLRCGARALYCRCDCDKPPKCATRSRYDNIHKTVSQH